MGTPFRMVNPPMAPIQAWQVLGAGKRVIDPHPSARVRIGFGYGAFQNIFTGCTMSSSCPKSQDFKMHGANLTISPQVVDPWGKPMTCALANTGRLGGKLSFAFIACDKIWCITGSSMWTTVGFIYIHQNDGSPKINIIHCSCIINKINGTERSNGINSDTKEGPKNYERTPLERVESEHSKKCPQDYSQLSTKGRVNLLSTCEYKTTRTKKKTTAGTEQFAPPGEVSAWRQLTAKLKSAWTTHKYIHCLIFDNKHCALFKIYQCVHWLLDFLGMEIPETSHHEEQSAIAVSCFHCPWVIYLPTTPRETRKVMKNRPRVGDSNHRQYCSSNSNHSSP